jgi:hypothetical protein
MPRHPTPVLRVLVGALAALALPAAAHAKPAHKQALIDFFGPALPAKLHDCRTCHLPAASDDPSERPHNAFGARLKAVRAELRKAGKQTDIATRLQTIADEDSDGDGVSNFLELLSGHWPGDAADRPAAAEVADARRKLADLLQRQRSAYAWRPFEPVRRPPVPTPQRPGWGRNAVDAFLAVEHERQGLRPRPEAPRAVLLRRVYLDLTGLPPTRAELHAFLDDPTPDAYEKVVDRLLASPSYGERWGRHWMDVWRYSDWAGYGAEVRDSQKHIWHWRDWIVESLNIDKGYDRMVQEMLAADELAPEDPAALRATGFLVRNWYKFNRNVWLERTVEHTGKAFLGVTLNCARCHDHFFDPFTQQEFYAFRAAFEPHDVRTDRLPGVPDLNADGLPRVYDGKLAEPTYLFVRGDEKHPDKKHPITPAVPAALGGSLHIEPVKLPRLAAAPDKRDFVIAETVAASKAAAERADASVPALRRTAAALVASNTLGPPLLRVAQAAGAQRALELLAIGELEQQAARERHAALLAVLKAERLEDAGRNSSPEWKEEATAARQAQRRAAVLGSRRQLRQAHLERCFGEAKARAAAPKKVTAAEKALAAAEAEARKPADTAYTRRNVPTYPATSSGRRLALARWITDRQNPLAARVAMNHLWLRHFGRALVPTEFDFGRNGQAPTHPALLDWLAAEFMDRGWRMKAMHRLLVTSAAYRQASTPDPDDLARDPDNRYLWRFAPRRLEAEAVRDSALAVAGNLDPAMGGPDLDHALGLTSRRRSLYFRHAAEKQMEFLTTFDAANVSECYRRSQSIVPQQALALANSSLALAQSRLLARALTKEVGPGADDLFIRAGFEQVLGRPPTADEQAACRQFLADQAALLADRKKLTAFGASAPGPVSPSAEAALRAREGLIHVLLNHHEFVTIR